MPPNPKIAVMLIGDGRHDYRERTIASLNEMVSRRPDHVVEVDDTEHKLGFSGAIQAGWEKVIATGADYVFHLELDFTFNRPVPLDQMVAVLKERRYLAQICLLRQPWNAEEKAAGGIVQLNPDDFEQKVDGGDIWTEHRRCFSTNPCLYPVALCHQGWPQVEHSEGVFTHRLLEDPDLRFAYWGAKFDEPMVHHIGDERAGHSY